MTKKRIFWIIVDSLGVGAMPDAAHFKPLPGGDVGANTLGHIIDFNKGLNCPTLQKLGLANILISDENPKGNVFWPPLPNPIASYGRLTEISAGKDTPSGHWEMAGAPVSYLMPVYYDGFAPKMVGDFIKRVRDNGVELPGTLWNKPASGTEIIKKFGEESIASGKIILYTSGDSVFQIAAHEEKFGLEKLYRVCEIARSFLNEFDEKIGRVIARPFIGDSAKNFERTPNRRDYSLTPPRPTVLQAACAHGYEVISIGKIADIFAHQGFTQKIKSKSNKHGLTILTKLAQQKNWQGIAFVNLVEFDSHYGHRRDPKGYAKALKDFDGQLPEYLEGLTESDLMLISADHGCDPTFPGSDHTREYVPILSYQKNRPAKNLGTRETFADVAATITRFLNLDYKVQAKSWI